MLWTLASLAFASNPYPELGCGPQREPGPPLSASWAFASNRVGIAVVGGPAPARVVVRARAWFSGLEIGWEQVADIEPGGCRMVPFDVPDAAFQHPLADTFVTDLWVQVVPVLPSGREGQETALPAIFAHWPSGPDGDAVLWDAATMQERAPFGVVDPAATEGLPDGLAVGRVLAPIQSYSTRARTSPTDARTISVTVPVDDQRDEEGRR